MFRRRKTPSLQEIHVDLHQALQLWQQAHRVVVLTGAGISTPSGIPDFRSDESGLWSFTNPLEVASLWGFRERPQRFYRWFQPLARDILQAQPNPAHTALAQLEQGGKIATLITQNIDGLHQKAGSQRVLELHGHLRRVHCLHCGWRGASEPYLDAFLREGTLPLCPQCGEVMKPEVVLFGEPLPHEVVVRAQEEALHSDLMVVVGSSLEVMPAADLPALAVRSGARLIIATLGMTPLDHLANVLLRADVAEVLPWLAERLLRT